MNRSDPRPSAACHGPHKHFGTDKFPVDPQSPTLVLVGNPNVGKSVVFNYLGGVYVDVSNFPGTTVEISRARYKNFVMYDTPGIYGVSSFNDEERVARDIILNADVVLNVVDALHLERDLFLTLQVIDMGKKVVVALNMMDEVRHHHMDIDVEKLSELLGVPVVETVAVRKAGLDNLPAAIEQAREGNQDPGLHHRLHEMLHVTGSQGEALLLLEGDEVIAERHGVEPMSFRDEIYIARRNRVNEIIARVVTDVSRPRRVSTFVGRLAINTWVGIPLFLVILYLMYLFVGSFVAQDVVNYTEKEIGNRIVEFSIKKWVGRYAGFDLDVQIQNEEGDVVETRQYTFVEGIRGNPKQWEEAERFGYGRNADYNFKFHNPLLVIFFGRYGAFSMTLTYLVFLLLPLVLAFYLSLSVLEDSGYLPRLATLVDRLLRMIGLNGRAVIPLILGFGCVTVATITTRLLNTRREKTIATAILQLAIPCSAQLAVIAALLTTAGFEAVIIYVVIISVFLVSVGTILNRVLPGAPSPLLLDLPPMRLPRAGNVVRKTLIKTYHFMKEATLWFFLGAVAVSLAFVTSALDWWRGVLEPVTTLWLKLPREAADAFIMGLVRRDFGAAGFYDMNLSPMQVVVALVTITLFVPCIASLMVMLKERGVKEGMAIWVGSWILSFLVGGITAQILL